MHKEHNKLEVFKVESGEGNVSKKGIIQNKQLKKINHKEKKKTNKRIFRNNNM